jgi:hypothetical protein
MATAAPGPGQGRSRISLQEVLTAVSAAGAVLYTVLILMYERFYRRLGIEPEDVGLDRGVVVVRALGGVLAIAAVAVVLAVVVLAVQLALWAMARLFDWLWGRALARVSEAERSAAQKRLNSFRSSWWVRVAASIYPVPGVTRPEELYPFTRYRVLAVTVVAAILAIGLPLTIGVDRVDRAARAAESGGTVTPLTFAGLRVLDIESRPCRVTWLGEAGHMPDELSSEDLHCLGATASSWVFRTRDATLRVPAGHVAVASD